MDWGEGKCGDVRSVNGEDGERLLSQLSPFFLENIDRVSFNDGSRELIPVFLNPLLGVPCRGGLLGSFEQEGGKTSSEQYPKGL